MRDYIGCIGANHAWLSSDVIVMLKWRHHVMSYHSVSRNFEEPFFFINLNAVFNGEHKKNSLFV